MVEVVLKAKVSAADDNDVTLEFGSTQADMWFSGNGKVQRLLKLKEKDKVEIIIRKM
jgi:hypothetical protein